MTTAPAQRTARETLGAHLRRVRVDALDLSQAAMADWLGLTTRDARGRPTSTGKSMVSRFERGERVPDAAVLEQYLKAGGDEDEIRALWAAAAATAPEVGNDSEVEPAASADPTRSGARRRPGPPTWWAIGAVATVIVAAVVVGAVALPGRGDRDASPPPRREPVAGVSFVFDALGQRSDQTIHVYAGYGTSAADKQVSGNFQNGQSAPVVCTVTGRVVASHPEDGEESRTSDRWVRIVDQTGRDSYATLTYGRISPTTASVPAC